MLSVMAPHGREMSQDLRKKIISLHKKGEGYKKISKALLISQNTVAKVVQTFKKDGTVTISQRRPGRPRKLTPCQEHLLMRRVEENRHASSLQLSKEVESQTGVTISRDTIRRTLQRNGMHGCRPRKKPLLKPRHKKALLEFARAHADKDEDYWDSILWSDETKINVFGTDGFTTVWRRKGEEYKEKCMVPTVKHGGGSVLMWGCMSAAGVGELHFIDGIMNSQMYCSILKEKMLPSLRALGRRALFQHDYDPKWSYDLRPLLYFWRRTGWKWFSGQVCLLIWTQSNTYGEFWRDKLSITLHPASNLQKRSFWQNVANLFITCLEDLVLS